jgi:hypothetical protein
VPGRSFGHAIFDRRLPRDLGNVFVAVTVFEDQLIRRAFVERLQEL